MGAQRYQLSLSHPVARRLLGLLGAGAEKGRLFLLRRAYQLQVPMKMKPGQKPKTTWPPCARCGTQGGRIRNRCRTPARLNGAAYGHPGVICLSCYEFLRARARRGTAKPERPRYSKITELAAAVLAFEEIRLTGTNTEKSERYWRALSLARAAIAAGRE
jgi:hypothetical protein